MAERIAEDTVVRDLIAKHPGTRTLLERLGIDYCCGGQHTLREAAVGKGIDPKALLEGLNAAMAESPPGESGPKDWSAAALSELMAHILKRHHAFMHEQLPRLEAILARVLVAHAARHGEALRAVQGTYGAMDTALTHHLITEEEVVFPLIGRVEAGSGAGRNDGQPAFLRQHIEHLEEEHRTAGNELRRLRELTSGYRPPVDACASFRALYEGLEAMEADLHEHIHLENNILFPRALGLAG